MAHKKANIRKARKGKVLVHKKRTHTSIKRTKKTIHNAHIRRVAKSMAKARKPAKSAPKGGRRGRGRAKQVNITMPEDAKHVIGTILENEAVIEYLKKNVSKRAPEVINLLSIPRTDEYIAEQLGLKVNAVRRILNIMQGYGVTNYHVSKNNNGWLSFGWYINATKLPTFFDYISNMSKSKAIIEDNCNDYFICTKCFDSEKFVYTFDAAFEAGFKCKSCNAKLEHADKSEVEALARMVTAATEKEVEEAKLQT